MLNLVANGPSGYNLTNSLRFRSSASAYLSRTPTVAGNRTIWTWSGWVKLGVFANNPFFAADSSATAYEYFRVNSTGNIQWGIYTSGTIGSFTTNAVYRDPSAWYHVVINRNGTTTNCYVNGNQQSFSANTTTSSNGYINATNRHTLGANIQDAQYYDGYMTDVNFIDGQQLTPSSFGSTNSTTGVWQPAKYTGTYGTNGFYLNFNSIALTSGSNTGLGKDNSGNGNYWNTNNISVTAGTTYDAMTDVPTLTSATVANYCTLNPLSTLSTLANGNLTYSNGATYCQGSLFAPSGLFYAELVATGAFASQGIAWGFSTGNANLPISTQPAASTPAGIYYVYSGGGLINVASDGSSTNQTNPFTVGQTWQLAIDATNGYAWLGQNNTWYSSTMAATGNPVTGANPTFTISNLSTRGGLSVLCGHNTAGGTFAWNFGQRPFTYTPPTGFVALNTYNLPTSTIVKGNKYMDATLYTGNGVSQVVVDQAQFQPDFVWVKGRSGATDHALYDSVRGTTKDLVSNSTAAETTQSTGLTAFNSNGFTVGALAKMNTSAATYVGWQWQAGQGSTSSNTSGNVTSTVSVNTTAGFSVVTYTVTTTVGMTIGHGLGVAPKMIIEKRRDAAANWDVYTQATGNTGRLILNSTSAFDVQAGVWNNTSPTSTVFSQQGNGNWHPVGATCVAYCWAEIAGFSKFGSYTGNGSADGVFVYTGFLPKYILIKRTDTTANWIVMDTSRGLYNASYYYLLPNLSDADSGPIAVDFLSNGFKMRLSNAPFNASGGTYIYACFASNPFKNSNAV